MENKNRNNVNSPRRPKLINFLINLGLFLVAVVLLLFVLTRFLNYYTRQGDTRTVPDLKGLTLEEVKRRTEEKDLRYEERDRVYDPSKPALTVLEQNPAAGSKVKPGRKIYLTINSDQVPEGTIPAKSAIINAHRKQAELLLKNAGFKVGKPIYRPDPALDAVLEVQYQGRKIEPGTKLPMGSEIVLVLGDGGQGENRRSAPDLIGQRYFEARFTIIGTDLVVGKIYKEGSIKDSANSVVVKQNPAPDATMRAGEAIDITIKQK